MSKSFYQIVIYCVLGKLLYILRPSKPVFEVIMLWQCQT